MFEQAVDDAFVYVIEGELSVGKQTDRIEMRQLGILENGSSIQLKANKQTRFLMASAIPLNEPVVRGGPFVMNTEQQLEQAFSDFGR